METTTLRSLRQPSRVDLLLREVVDSSAMLPVDTREVLELSQIPAPLRRIAKMAKNIGQSCTCWCDGRQVFWLIVGEMSLERSREHGNPVMVIDQYGEDGHMVSTHMWIKRETTWQRLTVN